MILEECDFTFDFVKKAFRRVSFKLEIAVHPELSFDEKLKCILDEFKSIIAEFDDIYLKVKKFKKASEGRERPSYITAGYSYSIPSYKHYTITTVNYNFHTSDNSISEPYFDIDLEMPYNSNYYVFVYMLNFLDEKIKYCTKQAVISMLKIEKKHQGDRRAF